MIQFNPETNLIGSEPVKKIKFRVVKNSFMPADDYKIKHPNTLLLDNGKDFWIFHIDINMEKESIEWFFKHNNVKQVMILSRK